MFLLQQSRKKINIKLKNNKVNDGCVCERILLSKKYNTSPHRRPSISPSHRTEGMYGISRNSRYVLRFLNQMCICCDKELYNELLLILFMWSVEVKNISQKKKLHEIRGERKKFGKFSL